MFTQKAILTFNGLTIVMSNPSRFDKESLLTGQIGDLYEKILNSEKVSILGSDLILLDESNTFDEIRSDTKCLLIHGQKALLRFKDGVTVLEQRGSTFKAEIIKSSGEVLRIPAIVTLSPQDVIDPQDWEGLKNPALTRGRGQELGAGTTDSAQDLKSTHGRTRRGHYLFWFQKDIKKICGYLKTGWNPHTTTKFLIQPSASYIIKALNSVKGRYLYLDIETDSMLNMTCWAFTFSGEDLDAYHKPKTVVGVPFYGYKGGHSYSKLATVLILKALAVALRDNTVVCHNCLFDLWVLAWKYKLPPGKKIHDTMLMTHRCYPEMEKSLGHSISLWTDQEYHKNEGVFEPQNFSQQQSLRLYNTKDVESMMIVHQNILRYSKGNEGLTKSLQQVNESIRPYLLLNLTGYKIDLDWMKSKVEMNDRLMMQYLRILTLLCGYEINPGSSDQVAAYLISIGVKLTKEFPTNERNLYKYMMKKEIPVLKVVIKYRELKKETSSLKFRHYYGIGKI